jgi:hypothetical protein
LWQLQCVCAPTPALLNARVPALQREQRHAAREPLQCAGGACVATAPCCRNAGTAAAAWANC